MEEDIKILEEMLNRESSIYKRNKRGNKEIKFEVNSNYYKAIENLLTRYKQLEEENKDLQKSVDQIYDDYQDIGKMYFNLTEKIENKIEEYKKVIEITEEQLKYEENVDVRKRHTTTIEQATAGILALEGLLREE